MEIDDAAASSLKLRLRVVFTDEALKEAVRMEMTYLILWLSTSTKGGEMKYAEYVMIR